MPHKRRPVVWCPNAGPQTAFLAGTAREELYGGAVGGGKTDALIAQQLRYAYHPKHSGVLLRRTRPRLQEMINRARDMVSAVFPDAQWHETEGRFKFPSGATVYFGHAERDLDIEKFKSFEFNQVAFDELTEFTQYQYLFMLSRNRTKSPDLPLQMRNGTNPGGVGMAWVFKRFIEDKEHYATYRYQVRVKGLGKLYSTRRFVPSTVFDNPRLTDRDEYIAGLASMGEEMAAAMLYGRWDKFHGQYFTKLPIEADRVIKDPTNWYVIRCMDYGWTDPCCILWLVVYPKLKSVEVAAEVYSPRMTTDSIAAIIHETEKRLGFKNKILFSHMSPDRFQVGTDGSQSIASLLAQKGVWFDKANNDRVAGWAQIQRLLAANRLFMWRAQTPNLARTLLHLPRDANKPDDVQQRGVEDHAAETLRYGCMAYLEAGEAELPAEIQERTDNRDQLYDKLVDSIEGQGSRKPVYIEGLGDW
jgi:hypothetical protein